MTILETHHLTIGYTAPRKAPLVVAQDINVTLHPGELVCLIGPNGAGKSTLMRTLAAMQKPLHGNVLLHGADVHHLPANELAKRFSIVLTERPDVGLLTGYALVALGRHPYTDWSGKLTPHDEAMIRWAVQAVDAVDFASRPVAELSDGQRQKIMIARALAQEPALMLLDEPTAFLDLPRRVEIMRLLKSLTRTTDRAILLSTHELDLALRMADRIWLLPQGGDLQVGAPEDLVLNGAFETAFHSEGVTFDVQTGSFQVDQEQVGEIMLVGEGVPMIWTRRALEREGFVVVSSESVGEGLKPSPTNHCVTIMPDSGEIHWIMHRNAEQTVYQSIYDLVLALRVDHTSTHA